MDSVKIAENEWGLPVCYEVAIWKQTETIISLFQWWNTEAWSFSKCLQRLWRLIEWWNLTKSPIRKIKVYVFFETQLENRKCLEEDFIKTKYLKEINAKTDAPRNAEKQYF